MTKDKYMQDLACYGGIRIRSYSERFCNVAHKSKFILMCDVTKSFRIGPIKTPWIYRTFWFWVKYFVSLGEETYDDGGQGGGKQVSYKSWHR